MIICGCLLSVLVVSAIINTCTGNIPKDTNVYLNEEICFADKVYIKVNKMSVTENESDEDLDSDGDSLSKYVLNLDLSIQRRSEKTKDSNMVIKPQMFQLKSVNLKLKSKMAVFVNALFKATLSALVSGTVAGEINIIEETANFAGEYITGSIENAITLKTDFKPISANQDSFDNFELNNQSDVVNVSLHFPIKQEYLESENVIVLAVDTWNHFEKRIFLITRPN